MSKYLKHFIVVTKHRYFVMIECFKRGLYWQGIVHDLSKYHPTEFFTSARYFQGDKTPIGAEKAEKGYSVAWLHHKGHNPHHWEYWTDFYNGEIKPVKIPKKYMLEMCCDMIGASKAYNSGKFSPEMPLDYFEKNQENWCMLPEDKEYLRWLLTTNND